jgi:hypothetical protein
LRYSALSVAFFWQSGFLASIRHLATGTTAIARRCAAFSQAVAEPPDQEENRAGDDEQCNDGLNLHHGSPLITQQSTDLIHDGGQGKSQQCIEYH